MKKLLLALCFTLMPGLASALDCLPFAAGDTNYIYKMNLLVQGCSPTSPAADGFQKADAAGTVDAITATFSPAITLTDKTIVAVVASGANTVVNPTFAPNGLAAHTIAKNGNVALAVGDIAGAGHVILLEYNAAGTRWELLNPAVAGGSSSLTSTRIGYGSGANVLTGSADLTYDTSIGQLTQSKPLDSITGLSLSNLSTGTSASAAIFLSSDAGQFTLLKRSAAATGTGGLDVASTTWILNSAGRLLLTQNATSPISVTVGGNTASNLYLQILGADGSGSKLGNIGIGGVTNPTSRLHISAGTATAGTAPLKLTSGTVLGTPEAGAIEYDGTSLYYTDGTATRQTISTGAGAGGSVTVSTTAPGSPTQGKLWWKSDEGTLKIYYDDGAGAAQWVDSQASGSLTFLPQNSKSAAYTTVLADGGGHILHPSADTTARVFTIDSNANVPYPIGTMITIVNQNAAGVITLSITSDTMRLAGAGTTGSRTIAANCVVTALKITATEWIVSGGVCLTFNEVPASNDALYAKVA